MITPFSWWHGTSFFSLSSDQRPENVYNTSDVFKTLLFGAPEESILGPILFIIFSSVLFHIYNDLDYMNYADDISLYVCRQNYTEAIELLQPTINNIFTWFKHNRLLVNSGKSLFWFARMRKPVWKY